MNKFVLVMVVLFLSACSTPNRYDEPKFIPVIGGNCISEETQAIWAKTKPGDTVKKKDFFSGLNRFMHQLTVLPIAIADSGHMLKSGAKAIKGEEMPQCGNWCGGGYPKPNENPEPIDAFDRACMNHDLCYREKGLYNCACDQDFAHEVLRGREINDLAEFEKKVVMFFAGSDCEGGCKRMAFMESCSDGKGGRSFRTLNSDK